MSETKRLLTEEEIAEGLKELTGWERDGDALRRELVFDDFVQAFAFMAGAALVAERMNHHPNWSNVYKKVEVELTTHEAGGITRLDLELARRMDALAGG